MPEWNLGQLLSRTTAALGNRTDITLSDASFWVNQAHSEVWDALPHFQQEAIAISSTTLNEDKIYSKTYKGGGVGAELAPTNT